MHPHSLLVQRPTSAMPCVRRWYFKLGEAMVHLGLARWNKDFDSKKPYDVLFYILRPDLIFSFDQTGWNPAMSEDACTSAGTLKMHEFDTGEVTSEKGTERITITGGCTMDCKALPGMITHKSKGLALAAMKNPPRSSFKDAEGNPIEAKFFPHPSGGFVADLAGHWMRGVIAPCFEDEIQSSGLHALGLTDGLSAHLSPQMVDACESSAIDLHLRVPHSSHRTQVWRTATSSRPSSASRTTSLT